MVSRWESLNDLNTWHQSKQRIAVETKIEAPTSERPEYKIYAPMVADTDQGLALIKKTWAAK